MPSLKRTRNSVAVVAVALALTSSSSALSTLSAPSRRSALSPGTDERLLSEIPQKSYVRSFYTIDEESDDDDWDSYMDEFDLDESITSGFKELQRSTGSEILDSDLQGQLDGISHPNQFLDRHVADATAMEKIAMSSITEQLPQAAVDALVTKSKPKAKRKKKGGKSNTRPLSFHQAGHRVTPEQEIALAVIIQKGAKLEAVREEAEAREDRAISKQEWADLAGMSTKELRREIALYRRAKHQLVTANIGLVGTVVNQHWSQARYLGITKEELIQEGSLGLLRAAELFDPSRGLRFSTYAVVWIKGILSNSHVQEIVRLPDREKRRWRKIQQATTDLEEDGAKDVTLEQLSAVTGLSPSDILFTQRKMNQAQSLLSLDYEQKTQTRSGTETNTMSTIHNDRAMQEEDMQERTQLQADVIAAMARNLDAREARLMRLRYGLSDGVTRSLQECADAMGLSYTRVQQLSKQCLRKLREAAEAESLQEYFLTIA